MESVFFNVHFNTLSLRQTPCGRAAQYWAQDSRLNYTSLPKNNTAAISSSVPGVRAKPGLRPCCSQDQSVGRIRTPLLSLNQTPLQIQKLNHHSLPRPCTPAVEHNTHPAATPHTSASVGNTRGYEGKCRSALCPSSLSRTLIPFRAAIKTTRPSADHVISADYPVAGPL